MYSCIFVRAVLYMYSMMSWNASISLASRARENGEWHSALRQRLCTKVQVPVRTQAQARTQAQV